MKKLSRILLLLGIGLVLGSGLALPLAAQEMGPGTGQPIIEPNFGGDIATLNPLLATDNPSLTVMARIYPFFIQQDPITLQYTPGAQGSLARDWTISDDGLVYTFNLRDDMFWSDGTPVTSADVRYFYDAATSGEIEFGYGGQLAPIVSLETPDPQTVVITFDSPVCSALDAAFYLRPVPAHIYMAEFGTDYGLMSDAAEFNLNPPVTSGMFAFRNFRPGEQVTLVADQTFPDTQRGFVVPEGWIYRNLENQTVVMESFLAGEIDMVTSVPADRRAEARERAANGEFQIFEGPSSGWQYIQFNLADPANPQNGVDEEGNLIDQGNHPIFGDVRVRQALIFGTDYSELNEKAFFGTGIPIYSPFLTYSWAYNDQIQPRPYDPEQAMALLEEAGWTDEDGDGIRECHGCLYAEEGTPLSWELLTFTGNTSVDATVVLMKDQLAKIGMEVRLNVTEFQTMLDLMDAQTIDAVMLFLGSLDPNNPDELRDVFTPEGDVIGSGFNWGSYNNPEVTELFEQGRTLPGCATEERIPIYHKIQEIMNEDVPWFFINTTIVPAIAQANIENWSPTPGAIRWNLDEWFKS